MISKNGLWEYIENDQGQIEITACRDMSETLIIPSSIDGADVTAVNGFAGSGRPVMFPEGFRNQHLPGGQVCYWGDDGLPARTVIVSEGIQEICRGAFAYSNICSISLPSSLRTIRKAAFYCCRSLEKVNIEEGLKKIGRSAFRNCTSLKEIILPSTVYLLGNGCFEGCTGLESAEIRSSGCMIGPYAFTGCRHLKSIRHSEMIRSMWTSFPPDIKHEVFQVVIPEYRRVVSVKETELRNYPSNAFGGKKLATLFKGTTVQIIREYLSFWYYVRVEDTGLYDYVAKKDLSMVK